MPLVAWLSVAVVSAVSLVGLASLPMSPARWEALRFPLVALAAGAMLGDVFLHLLPGAEARGLPVLAGFFAFFLLERALSVSERLRERPVKPVALMNLVGDFVHNLLDGVALGVAFLVSVPAGVATALAVVLHEVPQEMGDFAVLVSGGLSRRAALFWNFASALAAFLGLGLAAAVGARAVEASRSLVPLVAGGFIYMAATDLVPMLLPRKAPRLVALDVASFLAGVGAMWALARLE